MRLLADMHALLWWLNDDEKLGNHARRLIGDDGTTSSSARFLFGKSP